MANNPTLSKRRHFLRYLSASLFTLGLNVAGLDGAHAAPPAPRPLIVVFASGDAGASSLEVTKSNDLTHDERTTLAARAVRDRLNDSNIVAAVMYNPKASMYQRAVMEAKIQLLNPDDPNELERKAIGKGVSAVYIVAVSARQAEKTASDVEIAIQGLDIESGKRYTDKSGAVSGVIAPAVNSGDSNSVHRIESVTTFSGQSANNALQSAANTLVIRLLAGPLADFTRPAPLPSQLPPAAPPAGTPNDTPPATLPAAQSPSPSSGKVPGMPDSDLKMVTTKVSVPGPGIAPGTTPTPPISEETQPTESLEAISRQAELLLGADDANSAIVMLRRSINRYPNALPLRIALTKAYLAAKRGTDASGEAQRALTLNGGADRPGELELTRLLADAFSLNGDTTAARLTYERIIEAQPATATWARISLANVLLDDGQPEKAESLLRDARTADPSNPSAFLGIARLLADRGDYSGLISELGAFKSSAGERASSDAAISFFDQRLQHLGEAAASNRTSFDKGTLSKAAFYNAVTAQTGRVTGLTSLLKAAAPPVGSPESVTRTYKRRLYAASLLADSLSALTTFLDSADADAGSRASVQLIEFQREMDEIRQSTPAVR